MGSHTIPPTENQYQPLLDYCFRKYRDLNAREESLFSEIIDQSVLQQEMGKSQNRLPACLEPLLRFLVFRKSQSIYDPNG